jgi:hypothetical protein
MKAIQKLLATTTLATTVVLTSEAKAQLVYEGIVMGGQAYKTFIYKKQQLRDGRWRFQTKTVYRCGVGSLANCEPNPTYTSDWRIADCANATIDGKIVPARARYSAENGVPEMYRAICRF